MNLLIEPLDIDGAPILVVPIKCFSVKVRAVTDDPSDGDEAFLSASAETGADGTPHLVLFPERAVVTVCQRGRRGSNG